jgi:hypothetical protein
MRNRLGPRPFRPWPLILGSAALGVLVLGLSAILAAQDQGRRRRSVMDDNLPYDGRFVFARILYRSPGWGYRGTWSHDYPRADQHLPRILGELTTIHANVEGSNVFTLDDPALFQFPVAYLSEPGFWRMTEPEVESLRAYVLKGGFFIFDDFEEEQWINFEREVKRALPEYQFIEINEDHPIFHSFFEMKTIRFPHPMVDVIPRYFAMFEDNDPNKRMMIIANWNNDIAEYWEWSDTGYFPVDFTNEAYKLGVNYIVYAMTH